MVSQFSFRSLRCGRVEQSFGKQSNFPLQHLSFQTALSSSHWSDWGLAARVFGGFWPSVVLLWAQTTSVSLNGFSLICCVLSVSGHWLTGRLQHPLRPPSRYTQLLVHDTWFNSRVNLEFLKNVIWMVKMFIIKKVKCAFCHFLFPSVISWHDSGFIYCTHWGGGIKDVGGQSGGVRANKAHWGWSHLEDEPSG